MPGQQNNESFPGIMAGSGCRVQGLGSRAASYDDVQPTTYLLYNLLGITADEPSRNLNLNPDSLVQANCSAMGTGSSSRSSSKHQSNVLGMLLHPPES